MAQRSILAVAIERATAGGDGFRLALSCNWKPLYRGGGAQGNPYWGDYGGKPGSKANPADTRDAAVRSVAVNQESRENPEPKEDLCREPGDEQAEATTLHRTGAQEEETCACGADRDGGAPPAFNVLASWDPSRSPLARGSRVSKPELRLRKVPTTTTRAPDPRSSAPQRGLPRLRRGPGR